MFEISRGTVFALAVAAAVAAVAALLWAWQPGGQPAEAPQVQCLPETVTVTRTVERFVATDQLAAAVYAEVNVTEAEYVSAYGNAYWAGAGQRFVVAHVRLYNLGQALASVTGLVNIGGFLVTEGGQHQWTCVGESLPLGMMPNATVELKCPKSLPAVGPGEVLEFDLAFRVPKGEEPIAVVLQLGDLKLAVWKRQ